MASKRLQYTTKHHSIVVIISSLQMASLQTELRVFKKQKMRRETQLFKQRKSETPFELQFDLSISFVNLERELGKKIHLVQENWMFNHLGIELFCAREKNGCHHTIVVVDALETIVIKRIQVSFTEWFWSKEEGVTLKTIVIKRNQGFDIFHWMMLIERRRCCTENDCDQKKSGFLYWMILFERRRCWRGHCKESFPTNRQEISEQEKRVGLKATASKRNEADKKNTTFDDQRDFWSGRMERTDDDRKKNKMKRTGKGEEDQMSKIEICTTFLQLVNFAHFISCSKCVQSLKNKTTARTQLFERGKVCEMFRKKFQKIAHCAFYWKIANCVAIREIVNCVFIPDAADAADKHDGFPDKAAAPFQCHNSATI
jgi:hypothetical protein